MSQTNTTKPKRRFEEEGEFFIGSAGTGKRIIRLLCFRNHTTKAVGASVRFSRAEAFRKSRRAFTPAIKGAVA